MNTNGSLNCSTQCTERSLLLLNVNSMTPPGISNIHNSDKAFQCSLIPILSLQSPPVSPTDTWQGGEYARYFLFYCVRSRQKRGQWLFPFPHPHTHTQAQTLKQGTGESERRRERSETREMINNTTLSFVRNLYLGCSCVPVHPLPPLCWMHSMLTTTTTTVG